LVTAWRIQKWGSPTGTGWLDWEAGLIIRMQAAENVYAAMKSFSDMPGGRYSEWRASNPQHATILEMVERLRNDGE